MASEFLLHKTDASWLATIASLYDLHEESAGALRLVVTNSGKRTLDQNALQHCIYAEVSVYLVSKGRKDCNPKWVKRMLKNQFLGWTDEIFVNVLTGGKEVRQELRSTSKLDKGEAYQYTTQILDWACSIGCEIKIPAKCEYRDLMEIQSK